MSDGRTADKSVAERVVGASAVTATVTLVGGVLMVGGQPVSALDQVVDTLSDNPADGLTLREAFAAAGDGDTITFDPALFAGGPGTITALYGNFFEGDEVTLTGPGSALLTLTNPSGGVLYLYGGGQTVSGITIADSAQRGISSLADGGLGVSITDVDVDGSAFDGIRVRGSDLTLTRATITGSGSVGVRVGGYYGFVNAGDASLTISDSTIDDNRSYGVRFRAYEQTGGLDADVTVTGSSISGNTGGISARAASRGSDVNAVDVALTDTTVEDNSRFGMRIISRSFGVNGNDVDLTVTDSAIDDNFLTGIDVRSQFGGEADDIDFTLTDSTVDDNSRHGIQFGGQYYSTGFTTNSDITLTGSTVDDNGRNGLFANDLGTVVIDGSSMSDNDDSGVFVSGDVAGDLSVSESSFSGNDDDGLRVRRDVGGDVMITDSVFDSNDAGLDVSSTDGAVTVGRSTFSNSSAPIVMGGVTSGAEIVNSTFSGNVGDSVIEIDSGQLAVNNSTISGNIPSVAAVTAADAAVGIDNSIVTDNGGADVSAVLGTGSVDTTFSLVPVGAALGASNTETDTPLLGPLADNGGQTRTRLPLTGSPAIDAGDPAIAAPPATDQRGAARVQGAAIDAGAVEVAPVAPVFVTSLTPARFLDTRETGLTFDGQFQANGIRPSMSTLSLDVGGRGDVPADARAVVINVTAVRASGKGFVTAYPCGGAQPLASSLNYYPGVNIANELIVALPASGEVCLYTNTETHLIADVVGFVPASSSYGGLTPARLLDTRSNGKTTDGKFAGGTKPADGNQIELEVAGRGGVPADARAVIVNVTSVAADSRGFVTVHPCLPTLPVVSSLNYTANTNRANEVIAQLDSDGKLCVYNNKSTHLLVDVVGWLPAGAGYTPVTPARLVDTRTTGTTVDGLQEGEGRRPANTELVVKVEDRATVPADATGVVVNVTAIDANDRGFVTVYDCEGTRPAASSLNHVPGVNSPNELVVGLNADGEFCVYTSESIHVAVDVVGYTTD